MIDRNIWLSKLTRNSKGIWGVITPFGANFESSSIAEYAGSNCEVRTVRVSTDDGCSISFESDDDRSSDFCKIFTSLVLEAENNSRASCCLIVEDFHKLQYVQQCEIVRGSRAVQESQTQISCKVVLVGGWNYFSFRAIYREIHGLTSSPAAESQNILRLPAWTTNEVRNLLLQERILGIEHSDFDKVAIDFLTEQTAGDEFLLRLIVSNLSEQQGDWKLNLEQVLYELISSITVTDEISSRLDNIGADALIELKRILQVHRIIRDSESTEIEDLWLAGLVSKIKLDGRRNYVSISSPIINSVIRNILKIKNSSPIANPKHLCFDRPAISSAAYRNVALIENLLRNMVISTWYVELGEDWKNNLGATKTSSRAREDEESLVKFTMTTVKEGLVSLGLGKIDESETKVENASGARQVSVLDSASDWMRRQTEHHGVDLDNVSIMHFLTTESLEAVLCNKKNGLHGDNKPFKKESLFAVLEEYRVIRSAIAHNQPVKLNTVLRLEDILRKIVEWNTVFADKIILN